MVKWFSVYRYLGDNLGLLQNLRAVFSMRRSGESLFPLRIPMASGWNGRENIISHSLVDQSVGFIITVAEACIMNAIDSSYTYVIGCEVHTLKYYIKYMVY